VPASIRADRGCHPLRQPRRHQGRNIARQTVVRAGLPLSHRRHHRHRFCASGLQAIAMAAGRIVAEGVTP
jgi:acetyl-CoA C-acetyltransferase/acetyl-CoA acyltransferase